jgi:SAM-dependent methyltransferase
MGPRELDDVARHNRERWEELAKAGVIYSRPFLDLDREKARKVVDAQGVLGKIAGRRVLCLAGGGGQQSAAFALLGARVTVLDISPTQLERDREAAAHYGASVRTVEGDMRDLSAFADRSFDIVWHAHSLAFVPDARRVLAEVSRVLRRRGIYRLSYTNPYVHGAGDRWNGQDFVLRGAWVDGGEVSYDDDRWDVWKPDGSAVKVRGPREFRHTLATVVNELAGHGLVVLGLWDSGEGQGEGATPRPGSWEHFVSIVPPYLTLIARKEPGLLRRALPTSSQRRTMGA